uniref:Pre-mRNA-splicing factor 18 n=1 Tax=Albugo laibachii Nc14 TaxID=890382 RepID=F0W8C7_9STRA|nr:premRNAsplicing factor 18 putative [Albugo laibachii Nc14]CCA24376.1 premRNAsplicing factor 18 putative [Albugo laibachii Nc14]|eukprot:CCA24376.1 premRNAsplicing factor 18 putative [Albugo laibachii Nc14]
MEALQAVLRSKKREFASIQAEKARTNEKYLRRSEIEDILYHKETSLASENGTKTAPSNKNDSTLITHTLNSAQHCTDSGLNQSNGKENANFNHSFTTLSWIELKRRLRELSEPVTLFGESRNDRIARLQRVEHELISKDDDALGQGHDIQNNFLHEYKGAGDPNDENEDRQDDEREDLDTAQSNSRKDTEEGDGEDSNPHFIIYRFFKRMLRCWEKDLADRPEDVKRTIQGKIASKTLKQCKDYIRPLFKLCKSERVPNDILPNLVEIVKFCQAKEFVQANDAYIRLAIGNAAWPIGVTMVGIHERTGREKINANKQAHVMNNEGQRKYLTSVKRLMTYCQSISNVLPSKKVC